MAWSTEGVSSDDAISLVYFLFSLVVHPTLDLSPTFVPAYADAYNSTAREEVLLFHPLLLLVSSRPHLSPHPFPFIVACLPALHISHHHG